MKLIRILPGLILAALLGLAAIGCSESTKTVEASKGSEGDAVVVPDSKGEERSGVGRTQTIDE
ncbi:MAG: hypothetical protein KF884_01480 [Fimbriimonadaceae bacterium]|nr:hypothetical protein [Fimbriimonadaceae bacterium]QYK58766.1 MAG: hypothetical protein KF884_01480 [Fimbriimonadaceae bacterium]